MAKDATDKSSQPREVHVIQTDRQVRAARFHADGKSLWTGGCDAALRRWDVSGQQPRERFPLGGHHGWIDHIEFSPRHKLLLSVDSWGQLRAWTDDPAEPQTIWKHQQAHDGWIRTLALCENESLLATAGRDKMVRIWSAADGKLRHELAGHEHEVYAVAIHPDGESAVSGDLFGNLVHWDLANSKIAARHCLEEFHYYDRDQDVAGLYNLAFVEGGKTLLCAGSEPNRAGRSYGIPTLRRLKWPSLETIDRQHLGPDKDGFVFDVHWHPDGYFMLVTSGPPGNGKLMFIRPGEEEPFYLHDKMFNCHSLAVHLPTRRIAVAATNRRSQGNGAVLDKEGNYRGNSSPLHIFELPQGTVAS